MGKWYTSWLMALGLLAVPIHIAPDSHAEKSSNSLEYLVAKEEEVEIKPIEMVNVPYTLTRNPFDHIENGKRVPTEGKFVVPNMPATARITGTVNEVWRRYHDEQARIGTMRNILDNKKKLVSQQGTDSLLSGQELVDLSKWAIMQEATEHGRTTFQSRRFGNKEYTKEVAEQYGHDWIDCTRFVFEAYALASNDSTILNYYMEHVGDKEYLTKFPKFAAEQLRKDGFEAVYIAIDTQARSKANKYNNGMRYRTHAKRFFEEVVNGIYYTPIDQLSTDWDAYSQELEDFFDNVKGIINIHEAYHYAVIDNGTIIDAKINRNPYDDQNIHVSDLIDRMRDRSLARGQRIMQLVAFIPEGNVERFLYEGNKLGPAVYFVQDVVPKDLYMQDSMMALEK